MKKVTFGVYFEMWGEVTVEVPDDVTEDNVLEYLKKNFDEYPLPEEHEYVSDSAYLDDENIRFEED